MSLRIGVDTGGTFTDVCLFDDEAGTLAVAKVSSTPADPGLAVIEGVRAVLGADPGTDAGGELAGVSYFAHGTTVATNALLERRGATVGLITTRGLRDLLELGRQRRPKLYDLTARKPDELVPRDLRLEIAERLNYRGETDLAADIADIRRQAEALRDRGVDAVAICLLYSFLNPAHEQLAHQVVSEVMPDAFVSVSYQVMPEFREFERLSTTVVNAFVGPVMRGYLARLRLGLERRGLTSVPKITQSNGGVISFRQAEAIPVRTVLSGPSIGVVGAAYVCAASGYGNVVTFDMGGTSSDISVVRAGRPTAATGTLLDGRPIQAPMLDIATIGAGGGSLAWVDDGGHLKVGPRSAGADPGPACYGLGNEEPTVTDANVVLGVLDPERLLGGGMPIDAALAYRAVERLGRQLGLPVLAAAQGIVSVVTANMVAATRLVSVQRGYDPADYALAAFGGAGPLHAARLAAELGMQRMLVPPTPGAMSAMGMLMTDVRSDYTQTNRLRLAAENLAVIEQTFAGLEQRAAEWYAEEGIAADRRRTRRVADLRYVGQNYEISVDVPQAPPGGEFLQALGGRFHDAHRARYGYAQAGDPVELVTFRVEAIDATPRIALTRHPAAGVPLEEAMAGSRDVYLAELGERLACPVYDRSLLGPGHQITGPAVIAQYDTTTLLLPGQKAVVDPFLMIDSWQP